MAFKNGNIALVHDWFIDKSLGGAEKVTQTLDDYLSKNFSTPDIFSLTENITTSTTNIFKNRKINTSFIQKLPFGRSNIQKYLPLIPLAIEQIDLGKYDLIISSSHIAAKGVLTSPDQLHISYVHTPMRYAWDQMNTYINNSSFKKYGLEIPLRYILFKLREWDYISGKRPDYLIANSTFTSRRISKYWGLESTIIHPPVETKRFNFINSRENFYLSVNRLVPNKRVDLLIKAFNKLGLPLIIVGDGPDKNFLKKIARENIKFYGNCSNQITENLLSKCRAFVYAGIEDFGIAPVEAMASGAPVIAYGRGGLLDTVNCLSNPSPNKISTGILFKKQSSQAIVDTINWVEDKRIWKNFNAEDLNHFAQKFNPENFKLKIGKYIANKLNKFTFKS